MSTDESHFDESPVFHPPAEASERAHVKSLDEYRALYDRSINDPEGFWTEESGIQD